jgi:salicylate hydroxylase
MRIAIAGAGIGGLTAAVALRRDGHSVTVYEQASTLSEIGAGIQLSPNATRVLAWLGLLDEIERIAVEPARGDLRRWKDGSILVSQPLGADVRERYGFPYFHVHRADLHEILLRAANDGELRLGHKVAGVESTGTDETGSGATVVFEDGSRSEPVDLLVGADGIHSAVRRLLFGNESPRFSGNAVWRGLVHHASVAHLDLPVHSHAFLGPGMHFVAYYVSSGRYVNWVGVAPTQTWNRESWTEPGEFDDAVADFDGWCPTVTGLIAAMQGQPIYRWALFDRDPLPEWGRGPVTLLGDACHPMLPFMAQGAAQAIEDAAVLTGCLAQTDDPVGAARRYEDLRRDRTAKVQLTARRNEVMFHLPDGADQRERDQRLDAPDSQTTHRNAWLFDYDATTAAAG